MLVANNKKKGLLRSVWELVETLFVVLVIVVALESAMTQDRQGEAQQRQGQQMPRPRPLPKPRPVLPRPQPVTPQPLPVLVEDGEPRQGEVVLVGTPYRRSAHYFQEELDRMTPPPRLDYVMTWWAGSTENAFMMTALGRDQRHHVANAYLLGFQPFVTEQLWVPMQTIATRLKYTYDDKQFGGLQDLWQTSKQAYFWLRGDCEDHALLLADWLIEMGYDARVAVGTHRQEGHAWVVLFHQGQTYLLEATSKRKRLVMPLAASLPDYQPQYMFNRDSFWVNSGSLLTTTYDDDKWQERSRFLATSS